MSMDPVAVMTQTNPSDDAALGFGELRQKLVKLCAQGKFADAYLTLEDADIEKETARSLWEYLERQMVENGNDLLAETVRARLAQDGVYTPQMALADATTAVERGDFVRGERILRSVFGTSGLPPNVSLVMGRALAGHGSIKAVEYLAPRADDDTDVAVLVVDVLRANDHLVAAEALCDLYIKRFPSDDRFLVRQARVAGSLNKWDEALDHWESLSERPGFPRSVALGSRIRLLTRLERHREVADLMGRFLIERPALSDLVTVAGTLGLHGLVSETIDKAVSRHPVSPEAEREWAGVCEFLLDGGQLGRVAWLQAQGLPIGSNATEALRAARRLLGETRLQFETQTESRALISPDCLLPFPSFFRLRRPIPAVPIDQARILLVNASLVSGGAERQFFMMVKALLKCGIRAEQIDVGIFSLAKDRGRTHFLAELQSTGVRIHDMQTEPDSGLRIDKDFEDCCQILPKPLRGDVVALYHLTARLKPNVLHGWQDRASLACGFVGAHLGVDTIAMSARNMQPSKRDRLSQIDDKPLFQALCALPNIQLTANSHAGARDYEDWLGLANHSVPVLNNGLELDKYRNTRPDARILKDGDLIRITGVFRLAPNKRPLLWLNTIAALQKSGRYVIKPRMVGVGPLEDQVKVHARSIGIENFELDGGLVDPNDIYGDADVVLLMSRVEGTPNVLLEAQAMGIAVVGCDVGGVSEAVLPQGEGAGLILPEEIAAHTAAQRIEAWLPSAVSADPSKRTDFIRENFSLDSLGTRALGAYGFDLGGLATP